MTETAMNNPGERTTALRSRRYHALIGAHIAAAALIVVGSSWFGSEGRLSSVWAIAVSALYVGVLSIGSWVIGRRSDEVERRDDQFAATCAACFYALAFPVWYFLSKGQLVSEPNQLVLFGGFVATAAIAYTFKKLN